MLCAASLAAHTTFPDTTALGLGKSRLSLWISARVS